MDQPARGSFSPPPDKGVHIAIAAVLQNLRADTEEMWTSMAGAALYLRGVTHAAITVVEQPKGLRCLASTDRHSLLIDEIEQSCLEGPCLDSVREHRRCRVDDLYREPRWPSFVEKALANTSVRSILSLPLAEQGRRHTVLNLHADEPEAFSRDDEENAVAFAAHLSATLEIARREKQLHHTLANRDVIGQAKGKIMERFDVDSATAFALLARLAKEQQQSVSTTARAVVRRRC
jgi:GAF domain-containing protein